MLLNVILMFLYVSKFPNVSKEYEPDNSAHGFNFSKSCSTSSFHSFHFILFAHTRTATAYQPERGFTKGPSCRDVVPQELRLAQEPQLRFVQRAPLLKSWAFMFFFPIFF